MDVIIGAQVQSSAFPQFNFKQTGGGGALAQEWRFQINPDGSYHIYDITGGLASRFVILQNGNIGISNDTPGQRLTVGGVIESTAGGFKFPDGSVQSTAASSGIGGPGTITGVTAGNGLTGGGTSGTVTLSLTNSCSTNQILKWNGSSWACSAEAAGGISSIVAGNDAGYPTRCFSKIGRAHVLTPLT